MYEVLHFNRPEPPKLGLSYHILDNHREQLVFNTLQALNTQILWMSAIFFLAKIVLLKKTNISLRRVKAVKPFKIIKRIST